MRRPLLCANWKMHGSIASVQSFLETLVVRVDELDAPSPSRRAAGFALGEGGRRRGVAGACRRVRAGAQGGQGENNQQGDERQCGRQRDPISSFHGYVSVGKMGMNRPS